VVTGVELYDMVFDFSLEHLKLCALVKEWSDYISHFLTDISLFINYSVACGITLSLCLFHGEFKFLLCILIDLNYFVTLLFVSGDLNPRLGRLLALLLPSPI